MRRIAVLLMAAVTAVGLSTVVAGSAAADPSAPSLPGVVVADGLNNPRQMQFGVTGVRRRGRLGNVNATDAGSCGTGPEGPVCAGNTSSITRISNSAGSACPSRVVSGLLSLAAPDGSNAVGVDAVSGDLRVGGLYGIMTYGPAGILPASVAGQNGQLLKIDGRHRHPGLRCRRVFTRPSLPRS